MLNIVSVMDSTMNISLARIFILNFSAFEDLFSQETLERNLKKYKLRDFSTFKAYQASPEDEKEGNRFDKAGYIRITPKRIYNKFKEYKGEWERTVSVLSLEYIVPNQYQTKESCLLKDCLLDAYPYLSKYVFSCYHLDGQKEIYINALWDEKMHILPIYCPISALKNKKPQEIENRMTKYFKWYYSSSDKKVFLDKALSVLDSKVYHNLVEDITR